MSVARRPCVFLDRDGVINRTVVVDGTPHPPETLAEVEILPGLPNALRRLAEAGLPLIVVTNQPDVARGRQSKTEVERINRFLMDRLPLTAVYVSFQDHQH